jgi:MFS family permease
VALGLTGMALMVCEGAALGWSAIFLHDSRGASLGLAATAVTAYTAAQTAGRLIGDRLTLRHGAPALFRTGGLIAASGLTMALLTPHPVAAIAGFAVTGLGASVLLPLAYSAAGQVNPAGPGAATVISRFTTFTYAGILLGPAAIGWAAEFFGMTWTLSALIPVLFAVALLSRLPGRPQH